MNNKLFSILAVAIVLTTSCAGFIITEEREEPDGHPVVIALALLGAGGVAGWLLNDYLDSSATDVQPYLRLDAANNITDVMSTATVFTANANANYSQLWGMTKEHWIRQAELEAYSEWEKNKAYDGNAVLMGSRIYENNATMTANAVAQINSLFGEISDKMSDWKNKSAYSGKMQVGFALDNVQKLTRMIDVDMDLISVVDSTGKTGKVYIGTIADENIVTVGKVDGETIKYAPSYVYNFSTTITTITSEDGLKYILDPGKNLLSGLRSTVGDVPFKAGVYTITEAKIGGDTLSAVMGTSNIPLMAGLTIEEYGKVGVVCLDNDGKNVVFNDSKYGSISFLVVPDNIPSGTDAPKQVDLTPILRAYQNLLNKLFWTSVNANNAADAVWNIYERADAKNHGVTTLMTSNVYDSVVLSKGMNEVLTLSAMQQLASYFDTNADDMKDLKIGLYGKGMNATFVRGSIFDKFGNEIYKDVIFTPFFQSDSVTLQRGVPYTVGQNTLVAIWNDGKELNEWYDSGMLADGYETVFIEDGHSFQITQLGVCKDSGMSNVTKADFKVTKVDYIAPGETDQSDNPDVKETTKNVLRTLCIIVGCLLAIVGFVRKSPAIMILGACLFLFGVFFVDITWKWIAGAIRI